METLKPMSGIWTLTSPDGRQWRADSPIHTVSMEQRERIPADVALHRVLEMVNEPDFAERHLDLAKIYGATDTDDLIDKMAAHVEKLKKEAENEHDV